jgi:GNAT superfamily N-acetyltransferase
VGDGGFSLRPAVKRDFDFLTDMVVAAVNWDPDHTPATREQILSNHRNAHYVAGWPRTGDIGIVADDAEGTPIGASWLRLFAADDPGYGFVAADVPELSVGVVSPWRGKGVGRALLREVFRHGAAQGFHRISLSVERANRARDLYLDEGFTVVDLGTDVDTMVKTLSR